MRKIIRGAIGALVCLATAAILLGGGLTAGAQPAPSGTDAVVEASARFNACRNEVRQRPEYAPLAAHLPDLETNQFSVAQRADKTSPTEQEGALLAKLYADIAPCRDEFNAAATTIAPSLALIVQTMEADAEAVTNQLASGKLAWGAAARQLEAINADASKQIAAAIKPASPPQQAPAPAPQ